MPQTTPELRAKFPGFDAQACTYLKSQGYILTRQWEWVKPREEVTDDEWDALVYLVEEWDYGLFCSRMNTPPPP
jgi:hypothetical protein